VIGEATHDLGNGGIENPVTWYESAYTILGFGSREGFLAPSMLQAPEARPEVSPPRERWVTGRKKHEPRRGGTSVEMI